ncbi:retrovirus-related pol polyprotein from transposon TNT 1-94 [Tanacetum coccineum]
MKAKLTLLEASPSTSQSLKPFQSKNKGLVAETFDWDEEEVSDDEEIKQVKVLMALVDDELDVGKNHARNDEWIDITIRKCRDDLLIFKQAKLDAVTFQIQNTELAKLNHALQEQLKEERKDNEKWLNCSDKFLLKSKIDQESKIDELTKLVQMLMDEKINSTQKIQESKYVNKSANSSKLSQESKPNVVKTTRHQYASPSKQILKAKAKPFPPCTHCVFNDHRPNDCRNYPECEICGSYDHFTSGHNRVIHVRGGVLAESSQSSESSISVSCTTCGSNVHSTTDHNDFEHFKRGEKIQATKAREPTMSGCSRSMTDVKSYLHKYVEQPGPKEVSASSSYGSIWTSQSNVHSTQEQNGVAERKNKTIIETTRTMLNGLVLSRHFGTEVVRIGCYTQNRSIIVKRHDKTPYEIFRERIPNISYFYVFGCHVFIHNHKDHLGKFDPKADDGYFLGYSVFSKAFRVFNTRRQQIEETYHVTFDERMEAIRFINTLVDEIGIDDSSRYPPSEFLHEDDPL